MGAAFNNLMKEETKESLAKMCCDLMDELRAAKLADSYTREVVVGWFADAKPKQYEFLNEDFLALMNDIGRLGHEEFGADAFEVAGNARKIERHRRDEIVYHARGHLENYLLKVEHDKLGTLDAHLAAAAFNCMLEYIFSQGE